MPNVSGQRWSCHSCGDCCRTLVGHLFEDERRRIDQQGWEKKLGIAAYVQIGRGWVLNKRDDGACVFLDEHNRCRIHAEFGEAAKPLACRIFPFSVRPTSRGWQASLRFDCPSAIESKGVPLGDHRAWLEKLTTELSEHERLPASDRVELLRGRAATPQEVEAWQSRLLRWLQNSDLPMEARLVAAARLTAQCAELRLQRVRENRFVELLDLLYGSPESMKTESPDAPTQRQRALLRQLAFVHTEHVTLRDLQSGRAARIAKRWRQIRRARRFHKGRGIAPTMVGVPGETTFAAVEEVAAAKERVAEIDNLLGRYLTARIVGRSVCGDGYYGWPMFLGFTGLWLSVAAAGWIARYLTAVESRSVLTFQDVGRALGLVDRAVGRLPALGSVAERARTAYLLRDDGVARLLHRYWPVAGASMK